MIEIILYLVDPIYNHDDLVSFLCHVDYVKTFTHQK